MEVNECKIKIQESLTPELVYHFGENNVYVNLSINRYSPKGLTPYCDFDYLIITEYGLMPIEICLPSGKNGKFKEEDLEHTVNWREKNRLLNMESKNYLRCTEQDILGKITVIASDEDNILKLKGTKYFQKYNKRNGVLIHFMTEGAIINTYERLIDAKKKNTTIPQFSKCWTEDRRKYIHSLIEDGARLKSDYCLKWDKDGEMVYTHKDAKFAYLYKNTTNRHPDTYEPFEDENGRMAYRDEYGRVHKDYADEDDYYNDPDNY